MARRYVTTIPEKSDIPISVSLQFHIKNTANVAHICATEAARRNVAAYVRIQPPYYECSEKGSHDESDDPKPLGVVGTWWHEALRIVGDVEGCVHLLARKATV